ncbi:hypothetical protein NPIL_140361 [Nephila pilipes]|uniref:Uncharacterized protein n=1 Tax=Nephila pilipes TaxID=299642 RepID=A0A8X6P4G0_NEPPI|nr:hypothetical protein NPIL_140361 [Nephila pilipes]
MSRFAAKIVPRLLMVDQNTIRLIGGLELKYQIKSGPNIFAKDITSDLSCYYRYDLENKQGSSQWKIPISTRPSCDCVRSNVKTITMIFFQCSWNSAS